MIRALTLAAATFLAACGAPVAVYPPAATVTVGTGYYPYPRYYRAPYRAYVGPRYYAPPVRHYAPPRYYGRPGVTVRPPHVARPPRVVVPPPGPHYRR
jgi:hypothetical protein